MVPVYKHTMTEINKPKEITHHKHYDSKGVLTHYSMNMDGNVEIVKNGMYSPKHLVSTETVYARYSYGNKKSDTHNFTKFDREYLVITVVYEGYYSIKDDGVLMFSDKYLYKKGSIIAIAVDTLDKSKNFTIERVGNKAK